MRKLGLATIGLLVMLSGCKKPDNTHPDTTTVTTETTQSQDPNRPDSFSVVKICGDSTKVYLLTGGAASGQYAVWDNAGNGSWELLAPGVSPDSVCSK